ncbi:MAG: glycosyltransferase [Actinobacteria bacterium]|nr:MAG: glycosyltransferase [Actinomycetota bacterium]
MRVLLSAYACEPGSGSEPGLGWGLATAVAAYCEVTVITRANNRPAIEAALESHDGPAPRFAYYDLPAAVLAAKRTLLRARGYHYVWQLGARRLARELHADSPVNVAHHVTFVSMAAPSACAGLGVPFVWGPVGGGERVPPGMRGCLSPRARAYEAARSAAFVAATADPVVRATARAARVAYGTTPDSAAALRRMGAPRVEVLQGIGSDAVDDTPAPAGPAAEGTYLVTVGRLLGWKGVELAVRAFARSGLESRGVHLVVIGDGPERARLVRAAREASVPDAVEFAGAQPRMRTLAAIAGATALVHPSLHDSGGMVCLEAMARGVPVIALDAGGPGVLLREGGGVLVPPTGCEEAVDGIARAMAGVVSDPDAAVRMGQAGARVFASRYEWGAVARAWMARYEALLADRPTGAGGLPRA